MIKDTVGIKITEEFKEGIFELIDKTIEKVLLANETTLSTADKKKIKNLSLDQLNVNITSKINSKTLWVFSAESTLPITIEREPGTPKGTSLIKREEVPVFFKMKPNFSWIVTKKNDDNTGLTKKEFEEKVLLMLTEDIETAAFYGTASYIGK